MTKPDCTYKSLLQTANLTIGYRSRNTKDLCLQEDLNLELIEGELICLIGPNGCGKSTLIRTLAGLQNPLSGSILIENRDISIISNARRSELISVVLTDRDAVENITVREVVSLGRYHSSNWLGQYNQDDEKKISMAISQVGLSGFDNRKLGSLSDGEKQRSFIAKALASDSAIMLLDEPTAHLDIPNRVNIMTFLRQLTHQTGHSILVSTHDLDLALQLADEIWLMMPEKKIFQSTPEELLVSGYLDTVFGNETLSFNPNSGNFCVKTDSTKEVFVDGNGTSFELTLRALPRMGFIPGKKMECDLKINVNDSHWSIWHGQSVSEFENLSDTCRFLRKIKTGLSK
jgi:iron complex transport system ATP-binding protein